VTTSAAYPSNRRFSTFAIEIMGETEFLQHLKAAPALSGPGFYMRLRS
jgi:hypothetical protein